MYLFKEFQVEAVVLLSISTPMVAALTFLLMLRL